MFSTPDNFGFNNPEREPLTELQVLYVVPFGRYDSSIEIRAKLIEQDPDNANYTLDEAKAILEVLVAKSLIERKKVASVMVDGYKKIDSRSNSTLTPKSGILVPV
jgi:hypothetical protein